MFFKRFKNLRLQLDLGWQTEPQLHRGHTYRHNFERNTVKLSYFTPLFAYIFGAISPWTSSNQATLIMSNFATKLLGIHDLDFVVSFVSFRFVLLCRVHLNLHQEQTNSGPWVIMHRPLFAG